MRKRAVLKKTRRLARSIVSRGTRGLLFVREERRCYFSPEAAFFSRPGATTGWRNGIMARSFGPSCSIGSCCSRWRVARKLGQPFSFSSIHFFACLPGDDARTGRIVALFGGITDGVAHVAEATAVDQVDDELEFVQAFEISDLGLVACFCQRFETCLDQFTDAAAEYGLFAKKVGFSLFGKSGFKNAGARAAESFGVRKSEHFRSTACIPFDGEERRGSAAFREHLTNTMTGCLWSNHGDVDGGRRLDRTEADVEAVREHKSFARLEIRLDRIAIELGLFGFRGENNDDVGPGHGFRDSVDGQPFLLGFCARSAGFMETDADGDAAIAEIQRVRMALRPIADDGYFFCLDQGKIRGIVIIEICHSLPLAGPDAAEHLI